MWLERKILPESILRTCMDDIGVSNDDTAAGLSLRRPSRAERAVDDPLREMEGMLVDEYGRSAIYFFLYVFLVLTLLLFLVIHMISSSFKSNLTLFDTI